MDIILSQMSRVMPLATGVNADGRGWDITSFLENATTSVQAWGGAFLVLVGVVGVIFAAFQVISGMMSEGKKQVSYGKMGILLLISGALATTGLSLVLDIAAGGRATIEGIGNGVVMPLKGMSLTTIRSLIGNGLLF